MRSEEEKTSAINNPNKVVRLIDHPSSPNVVRDSEPQTEMKAENDEDLSENSESERKTKKLLDQQEQAGAVSKNDSTSDSDENTFFKEHHYAQEVQETQQVEEKASNGVQYYDLSFLEVSSPIEAETLPLIDASAMQEAKKALQRMLQLDIGVLCDSELHRSYFLRVLSFVKDNGQLSQSTSMLFTKADTLFGSLDNSRKSQRYFYSKFASAKQKKSEIYTERGKIQDLADELQLINIKKSSLNSEIRDLELELGELKQQEVVHKTRRNNLSTSVNVMSKSLYAKKDEVSMWMISFQEAKEARRSCLQKWENLRALDMSSI